MEPPLSRHLAARSIVKRGTERVLDVDPEDLVAGFKVRYVSPGKIDGLAAIHCLTTYGRKHHVPADEIWIASDLKRYTPILAMHEAVEHRLRQMGYNYYSSHDMAIEMEWRRFGGTKLYDEYLEATMETV